MDGPELSESREVISVGRRGKQTGGGDYVADSYQEKWYKRLEMTAQAKDDAWASGVGFPVLGALC